MLIVVWQRGLVPQWEPALAPAVAVAAATPPSPGSGRSVVLTKRRALGTAALERTCRTVAKLLAQTAVNAQAVREQAYASSAFIEEFRQRWASRHAVGWLACGGAWAGRIV